MAVGQMETEDRMKNFELDALVVRENYNGWDVLWNGEFFFGETEDGDVVTIGSDYDTLSAWYAGFWI